MDFPDSFSEDAEISFQAEDVDFPLSDEDRTRSWIEQVIATHHARLGELQYVFCSDDYLLKINIEYLDHDTLTDIITFPYAEPPLVAGDIFISTDRVRDNAGQFGQSFERELHRVLIHGVLHLCGFGDKTGEEADRMRQLEDEALALLPHLQS